MNNDPNHAKIDPANFENETRSRNDEERDFEEERYNAGLEAAEAEPPLTDTEVQLAYRAVEQMLSDYTVKDWCQEIQGIGGVAALRALAQEQDKADVYDAEFEDEENTNRE